MHACISFCLLRREFRSFPPPNPTHPNNLLRRTSSMVSPANSLPPSSTHHIVASGRPPSQLQTLSLISLFDRRTTMNEFKQIHSKIIRCGLSFSAAEQHRMVSFCCSRIPGEMQYARLLFDEIPDPTPFIWNTMIRGYANNSSPECAVSLYIEMLRRGSGPDNYTYPFLLKAFNREMATKLGDQLHSHALKLGFCFNAHVQDALIHVYSVRGEMDAARELFDRSPKGNAMIWNAMIAGYNRLKQYDESLKLFSKMEAGKVKLTLVTLVLVISACAKMKDLEYGAWIHRNIENCGLVPNLALENALIDMYACCGDLTTAWNLFEKMEAKDVISWTAMVTGFANQGNVEQAFRLFNEMPDRDIVSWTAMINAYVRACHFKEALEIFQEMLASQVRPDEVTIVSVLTACTHLGDLEAGEWTRVYMERNKITMDTFVGNALIDMYSKCGCVESAREIFDNMKKKDKCTWTAMITGLAVNGHGEEALDLFAGMLATSVRPDEVTYIGVLLACAHAGFIKEGREIFSSMIRNHGIMPNVTHYGCMVDLLARAGQLEEALGTIANMPMKPNGRVWGALLGACRFHLNMEVGELAGRQILELEPENGAVYILLSNIYAKCNRWEEAGKMKDLVMERRVKKIPGCSMVEINGEVHEFVAGDRAHQWSQEIYKKLEEVGKELKLVGYEPDTTDDFGH